MSKDKIIVDYLKCASNWNRLGEYRIAASYLLVLDINGMETWTPREREERRIKIMNMLKDELA